MPDNGMSRTETRLTRRLEAVGNATKFTASGSIMLVLKKNGDASAGLRRMSERIISVSMLILLLDLSPAGANNGRVAWALPTSDITVDGDLSDWPTNLPHYAIELPEYGTPPDDAADFSATMQVAHDSTGRLLVAVRVVDQSLLSGPDTESWNSQDGLEIYVSIDRRQGDTLQTFRLKETLYGTARGTLRGSRSGPLMSSHAYPPDAVDTGEIVRRSTPAGCDYEVAINLQALVGSQMPPDSIISFDLVVLDTDADGSFSWMAWGPFPFKNANPSRLGRVLLLEDGYDVSAALETSDRLLSHSVTTVRSRVERETSVRQFLVGVLAAVTVLHLLLQAFGLQRRANLLYAMATFSAMIFAYISLLTVTVGISWLSELQQSLVTECSLILSGLFALHFLHAIFDTSWKWGLRIATWLAGISIFSKIITIDSDLLSEGPGSLLIVLVLAVLVAEALRVLVIAILQHQEGARIIGAGAATFVGSGLYVFLFVLQPGVLHVAGFLGPILAVSIYLARNVAHTSRQLDAQNEELLKANRQITEATANKSQFLRRMAHDLRSPMNAIIGYTRLVLRKARGSLDDRQVRNLENIETSSNNLLNLINDILDLSRIEAGHVDVARHSVDLRKLADECADALASIVKPGVELRRELADVGTVATNADRLRQVIMNLLGNATKFTETGSIALSLRKEGEVVELSVSDTGIGIPADDLPHIFDEFRQVERQGGEKSEGTGLGLAIARKTVELLGGQISATSEIGVGTTFVVQIPVQS